MHLTGNDLALAESGAQLAVAWWKNQPGRSAFKRKQIAAYTALIKKLSAINQHAYPYESSDNMPLDIGSEVLMRIDEAAILGTRSSALASRG